MDVSLRILRFNPEASNGVGPDERARWEEYVVPAEPSDRVLDLLHYVKWYIDGSLTFRRSCAHGVCGSDAMLINGRNRLACEVLVKDAGSRISVEPVPGLPVIKDLLVDMEPFWDSYRRVMPFLVNDDAPADGRERLQSQAERSRYDDTSKCILCAACTTSCPVFWTDPAYLGPAAIVNAHRFIFDSRDHAHEERLQIMADADGVWRCRTVFNCVEACPRDIKITRAILEVTQEIGRLEAG
jgi:succinate dehydrogenase / fumarate reductase, iron-sulfur subunit